MNEIANFCERGDCDHPSRFDRHGQIMQVPGAGKFPFDPNAPPYRIDNGGTNEPG
jgi:hypothetical protein